MSISSTNIEYIDAASDDPALKLTSDPAYHLEDQKARNNTRRRLSWIDEESNQEEPLVSNDFSSFVSLGVTDESNSIPTTQSLANTNESHANKSRRIILRRPSASSRVSKSNRGSIENGSGGSNSGSGSGISKLVCVQTTGDVDDDILEKKKNNSIWCLRVLTLTTLITAAVIIAVLSYTMSLNSEMQVFVTQYQDSVAKVAESINLDISNKLNAAKTFSAMYTSRYGPEDKWPNITIPNFSYQAKGLLEVADGAALSFNPIITNETRKAWEAHAAESAHLLGANELIDRTCDDDTGICNRIVKDGIFRRINGEVADDPGFSPEAKNPYQYHMVPVWQIYPIVGNWKAVMFNLHSELYRQRALDDMMHYKVPTLTGLLHLVQHVEFNPSSILFYPVFNSFDKDGSVVGSISIVFTWADILQSVLPDYIKGLIVVLEKSDKYNGSDPQTFSYCVSGQNVTLLGEGDSHDHNYHKYEKVVYTNVAKERDDLKDVDNLITYTLRIYPSKQFEKQYLTVKPLAMTLVVLFVFILTSCIFLCYDYLVVNRQNAIMKFAQKSGSIVNSMFPSTVRDRLFSTTEHQLSSRITVCDVQPEPNQSGDASKTIATPTKRNPAYHKIQQFLKGSFHVKSENVVEDASVHMHEYIQNTPPIADLFNHTTIMFADLVSFTEWSSSHSPEDVFYLLETLFLEFDKAAERMGVFKLGTIGDCYIAVAGVPEPRSDHAVVMAEFAHECRSKTNAVLASLKKEFGPSLDKLSMRFGLHSGPVTAGVLRGLKSRFELFGDTINTASRMESTSVPNKIQISEQTAKCLSKRGCSSWYQPREDVVHAKGKGCLQTYWLEIHNNDQIEFTTGSIKSEVANNEAKHQASFVHALYSISQSFDEQETHDNTELAVSERGKS